MITGRALLFRCTAFLAVIWIIGSIPLAAVLYEFRDIQCGTGSLGWFIATLYGSFFIYPFGIGGLSMAALALPLATSMSLARSHSAIYVFSGFYVVTTAIISFLEFYASPDALFQMPPASIVAHSDFLQGLRLACNGGKFVAYKDQSAALITSGDSYTGWAYYPGFVAQTLMQNALFVVFVAFLYYPKRVIVEEAPYLSQGIFFILGYAIFLGSIWCLFRLSLSKRYVKIIGREQSICRRLCNYRVVCVRTCGIRRIF